MILERTNPERSNFVRHWWRRKVEVSNEKLQELCRLTGHLLAHQAGIKAETGEIPVPRALVAAEDAPPNEAHMLVFTGEANEEAVAQGRIVLKNGEGQYRCWIFAYDVNLRSPDTGEKTGDALFVEAGVRGLERPLRFLQRYEAKSENGGFRLMGDVEPVQQEEWPPAVRAAMDAIDWRDFVMDGARVHPLVGELWDKWRE
jgi:hypothetical protein